MMKSFTWKLLQTQINCINVTNVIFSFARKSEVPIHINGNHKKCSICEHIFTNTKVLQSHMKAVHKKEISKHTIEREPSLKNHKIKKTAWIKIPYIIKPNYKIKRKLNKFSKFSVLFFIVTCCIQHFVVATFRLILVKIHLSVIKPLVVVVCQPDKSQ